MKLSSFRRSALLIALCVFSLGSFNAQATMKEALEHLKKAKAAAEQATADKGGHRKKAIAAIDAAIAQVEAGIQYDKENDSGKKENKKPAKPKSE